MAIRTLLAFAVFAIVACDAPRDPASRMHQPRILVQPLGAVEHDHVDSVARALEREHNSIVWVAGQVQLPTHVYINIRSPRFRADTFIAWLRLMKPDSADLIVGITAMDISTTKYDSNGKVKEPAWKYRDFGIFGLAYVGAPGCIVSTYRLGDGRSPRFFDRLKKVAVHEVGHNRALPHCADTTCVMRDAVERITSIDAASRTFCRACQARLATGP